MALATMYRLLQRLSDLNLKNVIKRLKLVTSQCEFHEMVSIPRVNFGDSSSNSY